MQKPKIMNQKEMNKYYNTRHVSDMVKDLREQHCLKNYISDVNGTKTVEIMNACFHADKDHMFRPKNEDYIKREIEWYMSQSLNVNDIPGETPTIWKQIASPLGYINSNYGWMLFSEGNFDQYDNVKNEILRDRTSRRALAIYTRPNMHYTQTQQGMQDFSCTSTVQYLYREGKLNAIVTMRSNDAVFGYPNDLAWQTFVLERLCKDLKLEVGDIHWNVGSLHVYERHFDLLKGD
jgi:thymidylate synthase